MPDKSNGHTRQPFHVRYSVHLKGNGKISVGHIALGSTISPAVIAAASNGVCGASRRMGWERRRNGREYYYRSRREGDRVVKEYVGGGETGRRAAAADQADRDASRQAAQLRQEESGKLEPLVANLDEFDRLVDQLLTCKLLCAGWKRHHRQWRLHHARRRSRGRSA